MIAQNQVSSYNSFGTLKLSQIKIFCSNVKIENPNNEEGYTADAQPSPGLQTTPLQPAS